MPVLARGRIELGQQDVRAFSGGGEIYVGVPQDVFVTVGVGRAAEGSLEPLFEVVERRPDGHRITGPRPMVALARGDGSGGLILNRRGEDRV